LWAISLFTYGYVHAGELQVFSVKENPAGTVVATAGIFAETAPSASAFQLRFEDNLAIQANEVKPAPSFAPETSVILCVDQSGSMGARGIKQIQEALRAVLAKSELQLNLALWAFDTEVRKLRGFSKNTAQVAKGVSEIGVKSTRDSKTKLYEAIELGLSELRSHDDNDLKRLIVITDGKDDGSSITDQVIASKANAKGITIYVIGFGNVTDEDSELLARLTKNTGGHFILAGNAQELSRALHQLLNLPAPRVFNVSFHYDVSGDGRPVKSTQLEFTPEGKAPVLQTIVYGLSAPRVAIPPVPNSSESSDKWTINLLSINVDLRILLGTLLGGIVLVLAIRALRNGEKPEESGHIEFVGVQIANEEKQSRPQRPRTSVGFAFPAPSQGRPAAVLRGVGGLARGRQYAIERGTYRIGSGEANDLQLSDDYLSHKHATIKYDSGSLYLSDSESRNGTFLNDVRLDQAARVLAPGDRIRVGKSTLELVAPNEDQVEKHGAGGGGTRAG
jgi:hypothetical protein